MYDEDEKFDLISNQRISQSTKKSFLLLIVNTLLIIDEINLILGEIKSKFNIDKDEKQLNKCELNNVDNRNSNLNTFEILSNIANKCVSCIKIKMDDVL